MAASDATNLVAVDIGNSQIKIGRFAIVPSNSTTSVLPEPTHTLELPIGDRSGEFDVARFTGWCDEHGNEDSTWRIASVHRRAAQLLTAVVADWALRSGRPCPAHSTVTYRDVPLVLHVDEPARVGIDRLLAALAADRLRRPDRAAIIVDLGTAITVDLLNVDRSFAGGAILPGIALSARALAEGTDALPQVALDHRAEPPPALGRSTVKAIQAGLFWGAIGAIRELVSRIGAGFPETPDLVITGGASRQVAELFSSSGDATVHHVPHLVLAGIALVGEKTPGRAGG